MNRVATSSASNFFKRCRSSSDDSGEELLIKKPRNFYLLEPEITDYSDGSESIHSIQARTTDTAKDTSDTSSKSEDSMFEFEVVSNSDDQVYPFSLKDSSSPPEDILCEAIDFQFDGESLIFSDSDNCDNSSVTLEKGRDFKKFYYLFKTCVQCGLTNDAPLYRYCDKCYKVRKNFFPPRPKGRKHKTEKKALLSINSSNDDIVRSSCDSGVSSEFTQSLCEKTFQERMENGSEQEVPKKDLCGTCLMRSKDGGYVHNNIVHVYSCYRCSVRTLKQIGRCPVCNVRVRQVCRVITL